MKNSLLAIFFAIGNLFFNPLFSQNLHTSSSCPSGQISGGVVWGSPAGTGEYDWPDGNTSFTASNINGTSVDVTFTWSGETASFGVLSGFQTPNVGTTLSGGTEIVEVVTNGFTGTGATLTMTISPPIPGEIGYEIYHMNRTGPGGAGDEYTIHAVTTEGKIIYPTFTANGTPSWTQTGPGVVDANANSTAGQNDQVGVNFTSNEYIASIIMVWNDCSTCGTNQFHGAAFGSFDFCLDDWDADGIANVLDIDDDNDGIPDEEEKCSVNIAGGTLDWDSENWSSGSATSSFTVAGVTIDGNITSDGNALSVINEDGTLTGGTGENSLRLVVNQASEASTVTASWDFSDPVDALSFDIFDVDLSGTSFIDSVRIVGYSFGEQIYPTLTAGSSNSINENSALATGTSGNTSSNGNVGVSFSSTVDSVVIYWNNGISANSNPGSQTIGIHDFTWSRICTDYDSDGDGVPNHLDLDSDNDGVTDLYESGIDYTTILTLDSDGDGIMDPSNAEGTNGLVDAVETAVDNGIINYTLADTDGDGVLNRLDLDSDNDGITDLTESGVGTDANNDGIIDGSADADRDGMLDSGDSDDSNNGSPGTAATDTDGDGFPNFLDIDADNDGIIDNIEGQASTGSPTSPSGSDGDSDGTDNNFEAGFLNPVDTDVDGTPDYLDLNSDNDGDNDILEGWDTDNDGIANTSPSGTDSDNDGLDDNFDSVVGWNSGTNITNGGQTSNDFPNLDESGTSELDWREAPFDPNDRDGDGIDNTVDIDDDNDGILDVDEGCSSTIQIDIDLDEYENETSWTLENPSPSTILSGGTYADGDEFINQSIVVATDGNYTFTIDDSFGDGFTNGTGGSNSNGISSYTLTLDGVVQYASGNNPAFGSQDVRTITVAITCPDTDGDGIQDSYDLDSDGDGIADIIEAGGVDTDGDGRVDVDTDTDNDGWANTFDSDNGGTALTDPDTDGDGLNNREDIDADDDGIVDIIESQGSGVAVFPSGNDSDGDGIDNNFDPDSGNSLTTPINTDGTDNPDYTDLDSDNDAGGDLIEGWDTDNDGIADTSPSGTDSDGDGLDDNFDNIVGPNNTTNVTNNNQTSASFPNLDKSSTGLEDWREVSDPDSDGDGIVDSIDIDDDNDGILDNDEANCPTPSIDFDSNPEAYWTLDNTTDDATVNNHDERSDGNAPGFSTTAIQGTHSASFNGSSNQIRYSQNGGFMESAYTNISFSAWIRPTDLSGDRIVYEEGGTTNGFMLWLDDGVPTVTARNGGGGSETSVASGTTLTIDNLWHHVAATFDNGAMRVYVDGIFNSTTAGFTSIPGHGSDGGLGGPHGGSPNTITGNFAGLIDAARYEESSTWLASRIGFEAQRGCDTDGDGISDHNDLDSDNDGIPDIIEAGGVDANNDGIVDGVFTDTDNDGWANTFDSDNGGTVLANPDTDGDGINNFLDLDSDDDGIADIVEAGGTDSNNDGRADIGDSDGDGWSNAFDSDNGGTTLPIADTDGDGNQNYLDLDSDNDGITDNVEGQTTSAFQAPLGSDTDGDGWDNRYDSDNGGTAITLSNNEGVGEPDYLDEDSDGDGFPDWQEGFDDDEDGDALNDLVARATAYESVNTNPGHYVNSDDSDADGIPNWLEDTDGDGSPNFLDPDNALYRDSDGDGVVDIYDTDNNGAVSITPNTDGDSEPDFRDLDNTVSLPVELVEFTAKKAQNIVQLDWVTLSEINNDYFEVERLNISGEFEKIAQVAGAGNSNRVKNYRVYDESPLEGENYYRLKQVDFNGEFEYSEIKVVNFSLTPVLDDISIYPNPSNGSKLFMDFKARKSGNVLIEIHSIEGKFILSREINVYEGNHKLELLNGLIITKGLYIIKSKFDSGNTVTNKVVVL